jgi:hypothetical protein
MNQILINSYQFNPTLAKEPVIVKILVKALTAIPAPDFNLCLYLLAEHAVSIFVMRNRGEGGEGRTYLLGKERQIEAK